MEIQPTKFEEMERRIEEEFVRNASKVKGCFGAIFFNADDDVCKDCEVFEACEVEHAQNRLSNQEALEKTLTVECGEAAVAGELADRDAFRKAEEERKAREEAERVERERRAKEAEEARVRAEQERIEREQRTMIQAEQKVDLLDAVNSINVKSRVPEAQGVNWNAIVIEIVNRKPVLYKDAAQIVRNAIPNVWGPTAYGYVNKILKGLADKGVIKWHDKARTILWLK